MPVVYSNVYLQSAGMFLPGTPVDNAGMDAYVAPLNRISDRLKRRILGENGIQTRHYAIDGAGQTVFSNAQMAQAAIEAEGLEWRAAFDLDDLGLDPQ